CEGGLGSGRANGEVSGGARRGENEARYWQVEVRLARTDMADIESRVRQRLQELRAEYDMGQKTLQELESQAGNLRATLLRIGGAGQALQEPLGEDGTGARAKPTSD